MIATLFGPGTVPWLLRHDLRLAGRDMRAAGRRRARTAFTVLTVVVALLHLIGFLAAPTLARLHDEVRAGVLLTGSVAAAGAFALFLSKSISEATDALHQRGDLDLLLSSPLPMRRVLITRLLAIAVMAAFLPIVLVLPLVNGMLLRGHLAWIGVYPVLGSLSLTAASAGAALTFGLLAWIGPRWTVLAARVLATLFGAASFLIAQARFLTPDATRAAIWRAVADSGASGPVWWPARALLGEPWPMLALAALAVVAALAVGAALGRAYASGVVGRTARAGTARDATLARRFGGGAWAALLRKETLLLLRHPGLGTQLFYQFIFLVPGVIAVTHAVPDGTAATPVGVVMLTVMMTGRISRIVAAAPFESDPSAALAASAPVPAGWAARAKLLVTGAMLAVIVGLSLFSVYQQLPRALPAATIASVAAAGTRLWLAAAQPRSLRREGMQGRLSVRGNVLFGVLLDIFWAALGVALSFFV